MVKEEGISEEAVVLFLFNFTKWTLAFHKDTNLETEFLKWVLENRPKELVETITITLGDRKGKTLSYFIDVNNTLAKIAKRLDKEAEGDV